MVFRVFSGSFLEISGGLTVLTACTRNLGGYRFYSGESIPPPGLKCRVRKISRTVRPVLLAEPVSKCHRLGSVKKRSEPILSFKHFKRSRVEPIEEYAKAPEIKALFGGDSKKISKAYDEYCLYRYNRYSLQKRGECPGRIF